jgi:hypothetical protein
LILLKKLNDVSLTGSRDIFNFFCTLYNKLIIVRRSQPEKGVENDIMLTDWIIHSLEELFGLNLIEMTVDLLDSCERMEVAWNLTAVVEFKNVRTIRLFVDRVQGSRGKEGIIPIRRRYKPEGNRLLRLASC